MTYTLGVDLGTTTSAAAVLSDRKLQPYPLGESSLTVPSIVLPRDDGRTLIGEAAALHGGVAPVRLARVGDPGPAGLAGWDPHEAMCTLLDAVIEEVSADRGGRPDRLALVQPAVDVTNATDAAAGGVYGRVAAETPGDPMLVLAPIAAATLVDHERGLGPGSTVGVLDLGGDVSEAALVRRTGAGFDLVGRPCTGPGIGGVEIDAIVLRQIDAALDDAVSGLDPDADLGTLDRLLAGCRRAKEQLLRAEDAVVEVGLPRMTARVRLTRADLQRLVRPHLVRAVAALERTVAETGLSVDDLEAVVLVGGSARLPAAADLVAQRIGRPVVVGAAPEMTAALGAALVGTPAADRPEPLLVPPLALGALTPAGGTATIPAALAGDATAGASPFAGGRSGSPGGPGDSAGAGASAGAEDTTGEGGGRRRRFVERSVARRRPGDGQPAHRAPAPRHRTRWSPHLRRPAVTDDREASIDDLDSEGDRTGTRETSGRGWRLGRPGRRTTDPGAPQHDERPGNDTPPTSASDGRSGAEGDRTDRRTAAPDANRRGEPLGDDAQPASVSGEALGDDAPPASASGGDSGPHGERTGRRIPGSRTSRRGGRLGDDAPPASVSGEWLGDDAPGASASGEGSAAEGERTGRRIPGSRTSRRGGRLGDDAPPASVGGRRPGAEGRRTGRRIAGSRASRHGGRLGDDAPPASVGGGRSEVEGDRTGRRVLIASATVLVLMAVGGTLLATGAADRGADGQPVDSIETSEEPGDGGVTGLSDPARPTSIGSTSTSDPTGETTTSSSTAPDQARTSGDGHGSPNAAAAERDGGNAGHGDGAGRGGPDNNDTYGGDPANDRPSHHRGEGNRRGDGHHRSDPPTSTTNPPTTGGPPMTAPLAPGAPPTASSLPVPVPAPPPPLDHEDLVDQVFDALFGGA